MLSRSHIMSRDEQPADVFGNTCDMLNGRACAELGLYIIEFEAMGPDHARKDRVHHRQFEAIHRPAKHAHAVERFDARRTSGYQTDCAGWRNSRDSRVAPLRVAALQATAAMRRKQATLNAESLRGLVGLLADE